MRDRLTKKRVRVNYGRIIDLLGLRGQFIDYVLSTKSRISGRRLACCFLKHKKVNVEFCYFYLNNHPFVNYAELLLMNHGDISDFYEL